MENISVKAQVLGLVQQVGFRFHTAHEGLKLGLTGYAKNEADGSVTVLICGEKNNVYQLLAWLETGPPTAVVSSLTYQEVPWQAMSDFRVR